MPIKRKFSKSLSDFHRKVAGSQKKMSVSLFRTFLLTNLQPWFVMRWLLRLWIKNPRSIRQHCLMLTPDEAVKIPPVLDLSPAPPPKFKAIMQRIPIQGCPRIVSIKKRSNGSYCVLLMEEQRKLLGFFKLQTLRHICRCIMS